MSPPVSAGTCVIVHLASPREQVFGVVLWLDGSGVLIRGLMMASVDDWIRQVDRERSDELDEPSHGGLGLAQTFYPMHRIEKVVLDEAAHGLESIQERFRCRIGVTVQDYVAERHGEPA